MEINTLSEIDVFQRGIDSIADWASKWQLKLASANVSLFVLVLESAIQLNTLSMVLLYLRLLSLLT